MVEIGTTSGPRFAGGGGGAGAVGGNASGPSGRNGWKWFSNIQ
jgi:hypothetical protein